MRGTEGFNVRVVDGVANEVINGHWVAMTGATEPPRAPQQGLWDYLYALPGALETQLFIGLMIAGTLGMFAHYVLKWARDEIKGNLFCYLVDNYKSTLLSVFTYVGLAVTAIATDAFEGEFGIFVGWKVVFWMGMTNGFTIDAIVNRTERARWSVRERIEKGIEKSGDVP